MPRLSEPEASDVIEVLGDVQRFLPPHATLTLQDVDAACDRARDAIVAYQTFGAMREGQLQPERLLLNAREYQAELGHLQPFLAHCLARQIPLAEEVLRQIDPRVRERLRLGGLRRAQAAVMQLYVSLSLGLADAQLERQHAHALLQALAVNAPTHARALGLKDREQLRAMAQMQRNTADKDAAAAWVQIAQAMALTSCEGLCELVN